MPGEDFASVVGEGAAKAAKGLWKLWPDILSAGVDRFVEEVRGILDGVPLGYGRVGSGWF